jgi:hypothetical protein
MRSEKEERRKGGSWKLKGRQENKEKTHLASSQPLQKRNLLEISFQSPSMQTKQWEK